MFISFSKFLPFYIIFLLVGTFERIISTFSCKETKETKYIYYKWIFLALFCAYVFIVSLSVIECLLTVKIINLTISITGLLIFVAGVLLRRKSITDLGKNWSLYIEIKKDHELITYGIYKFMKHPYSLAVLFELIGVCLIANAFYSFLLVFLTQIPLLLIRMILEEKVLVEHFGDIYRSYRSGKIL